MCILSVVEFCWCSCSGVASLRSVCKIPAYGLGGDGVDKGGAVDEMWGGVDRRSGGGGTLLGFTLDITSLGA